MTQRLQDSAHSQSWGSDWWLPSGPAQLSQKGPCAPETAMFHPLLGWPFCHLPSRLALLFPYPGGPSLGSGTTSCTEIYIILGTFWRPGWGEEASGLLSAVGAPPEPSGR